MAKYFVHAGLEFQTVSLLPTDLDGTGTVRVDACTLESVVSALGTGIVMGADVAAQITTIRGWWNEGTATDVFQRFAREILNANAPLIAGTVTGDQEPTPSNVHRLAHEYILPPYIGNGITALAGSNAGAMAMAERNRIVVEAISVRHDNLRKFPSADEAWQAWTAYTVAHLAQEDVHLANTGYLINPPSPN